MPTTPLPPVPNYWDYLRLSELLDLSRGLEVHEEDLVSDELLFVTIHQALELWFKMVLRELRGAISLLGASAVPEEQVPYVVHHLRRANTVMKLVIHHFEVMETLTPQDFLGFRDKLVPASGFQSFQMRELEILLGLDESGRIKLGPTDPLHHIEALAAVSPAGAMAWQKIQAARAQAAEPAGTLRGALQAWLQRTPIAGSGPLSPEDDLVVARFRESYLHALVRYHADQLPGFARSGVVDPEAVQARFDEATAMARHFLLGLDVDEAQRAVTCRARAGLLFIESYRELPLLAWPRMLVDTVVELEEQLVIFRSRHARMVERIIGRRIGTGGSSGVDYLDQTTRYRIFTDLWTVRTLLIPKRHLPDLEDPEFYGFATASPEAWARGVGEQEPIDD